MQALSALVLGLALEFNDDSQPSMKRGNIQDIIVKRIGTEVFTSKLDYLKDEDFLKISTDADKAVKAANTQEGPRLLLDEDLAQKFREMIRARFSFIFYFIFPFLSHQFPKLTNCPPCFLSRACDENYSL